MGKSFLLVTTFLLIFISIHPTVVRSADDKKKNPTPVPAPKPVVDDTTNYDVLDPEPETGRQRAFCKSKGACNYKVLTCPAECPERKPKKNRKQKGCFIHCGSKCEATCKCKTICMHIFLNNKARTS